MVVHVPLQACKLLLRDIGEVRWWTGCLLLSLVYSWGRRGSERDNCFERGIRESDLYSLVNLADKEEGLLKGYIAI